MKRILFLLLALQVATPLFARNLIINCASTPLTQLYTTSSPSLALQGVNLGSSTGVVFNSSNTRICVNYSTISTTVAPTAGDGNEHCLPSGSGWALERVNSPAKDINVYVRADASNCTTGYVDVDFY